MKHFTTNNPLIFSLACVVIAMGWLLNKQSKGGIITINEIVLMLMILISGLLSVILWLSVRRKNKILKIT